MTESSQDIQVRKKRGGCGRTIGCLIILIGVALLIAAAIWFGPSLLRKAGLFGPTAEELYSGAPDREAMAAVDEVLDSVGVTGVDVLVIPISGRDGQIAVFSLSDDVAIRDVNSEEEADEMFMEMLRELSEANQTGDLDIEQVAMDYRDEAGTSLITIAASQAAVEAYGNGSITRNEFLSQVDVDISNLIEALELREILQEVR